MTQSPTRSFDGQPRWLRLTLRAVAWAILGIAGTAAALALAYIVMILVAIAGYEIGLWGPPFGDR